MGLDIRVPIGALFSLLGVLLAVYGFAGGPALARRSLGINIDLWWGLVLAAFGAAMLLLAWPAAGTDPQRRFRRSRARTREPARSNTRVSSSARVRTIAP